MDLGGGEVGVYVGSLLSCVNASGGGYIYSSTVFKDSAKILETGIYLFYATLFFHPNTYSLHLLTVILINIATM